MVIISLGFTVACKFDEMLPIDIDARQDKDVIQSCKEFSDKFKLDLRLYKTKNGHRAFVTNKKFNIRKDFDLIYYYFNALKGDLKYLDVAFNKEATYFHTRIVPKTQDFKTFNEQEIIKNFIKYQKDSNISVCKYIDSFGQDIILPEFETYISKHDYATKAFLKDSILV